MHAPVLDGQTYSITKKKETSYLSFKGRVQPTPNRTRKGAQCLVNSENKARKEIFETQILVDYLIHFELDFEDEDNFTNKKVREAMEWYKEEHGTE